jgi:hypothetical protein
MEPKKCQTILRCTMVACCFFLGVVQHDLFAGSVKARAEEAVTMLPRLVERSPKERSA